MWLMATLLNCAAWESNSESPGHNWATSLPSSKVLTRVSGPRCCLNITKPKVLKCGRLELKAPVDTVCLSLLRASPSWERLPRAGLLCKNQACLLHWDSRLTFQSESMFTWRGFFCCFFFGFFLRERERESEQGRGRERWRHRIQSRLQALGCQHRPWCGAWTHEPRDHDLSWNLMLNWLSHSGTPHAGWRVVFSTVFAELLMRSKINLWLIYFFGQQEQWNT